MILDPLKWRITEFFAEVITLHYKTEYIYDLGRNKVTISFNQHFITYWYKACIPKERYFIYVMKYLFNRKRITYFSHFSFETIKLKLC